MDPANSSLRGIAIDSSALVAMHFKERDYEILFDKVTRSSVALISAASVLESAIAISRRFGIDPRSALTRDLRTLNVQIIPFDEAHAEVAIQAFLRFGKGRHPAALNFGDCFSYALAYIAGLPLLYTGNDFSKTDIEAA